MTVPPRRPIPPIGPIDPRRRPRPALRVKSPYPAEIQAQIATMRASEQPVTVREPLTPFLVLRHGANDNGARPATVYDPGHSFWYEDVKAPGVRNPTPQVGVTYRFHVTITNLGSAPTLLAMAELYGGPSAQYPEGMKLFALAPFACPAFQSFELVFEARPPEAIVQSSNEFLVQVFDAQDPVLKPLNPIGDRHVSSLRVNKV